MGSVNDAGNNRHNRSGRSDRSINGGGRDDDWRRNRCGSSRNGGRKRRRGSDGGGCDSGCGGCSGGRRRRRRRCGSRGSCRSRGGLGSSSSSSSSGTSGSSSGCASGCDFSRGLGVLVKTAVSRGDRDADRVSSIEVQAVLSQLLVPLEEIVEGDAKALSKVIAGGVRHCYYWDRRGYRRKEAVSAVSIRITWNRVLIIFLAHRAVLTLDDNRFCALLDRDGNNSHGLGDGQSKHGCTERELHCCVVF